jgi:hypothetical protein
MRVLTETYDLDVRAYVVLDDAGELKAGIPVCQIADIMGQRLVTLPFSDHCDPLVSDGVQWEYLIEKLLEERCSIVMRCLHNSLPLGDERFKLIKKAKWHGLDLRPDLDSLWQGLHSSSRRAIRKAQRNGVTVQIADGREQLRTFIEMHHGIRKYKYRMLAQPYRFFDRIWHHFIEQGSGILMIAVLGDRIIGGALFLEWKDTLYYKFNASDPVYLSHRPNDLLIWEGIQYGKARGLAHLDFGLSDWDQEGLVRYKRKFASEEKAISFVRHAPNGVPTQQEQQFRKLLGELTGLFTDDSVPDSVTSKAGEILYRFFT